MTSVSYNQGKGDKYKHANKELEETLSTKCIMIRRLDGV